MTASAKPSDAGSSPRTVVIVGSGGGLGSALATAFETQGDSVVGWDLVPHGRSARAVDITDWESVSDAARDLPPSVDVLVNSAGISSRESIAALSPSAWERVIAVNLTGPFLTSKALLPRLRRAGGVIINVASIAAGLGFVDRSAYSASKAGLLAFTRSLALEEAGNNVRAVALSPTFVSAGMAQSGIKTSIVSLEKVLGHTPQGRLVSAEEVASVAVALASPAFAAVTGSEVLVDGGFASLTGF